MFSRETAISWNSIQTDVRSDYLKNMRFEKVQYHEKNFGIGFAQSEELLVNAVSTEIRTLPYKRQFQVAITYEIDSTEHVSIRIEVTALDWLASIGGLTSALLVCAQAIGALDDAQMQVTSAMLVQEKDDDDDSDFRRRNTHRSLKRAIDT